MFDMFLNSAEKISLKCHHLYLEQYFLYSLVCDLFSKNLEEYIIFFLGLCKLIIIVLFIDEVLNTCLRAYSILPNSLDIIITVS